MCKAMRKRFVLALTTLAVMACGSAPTASAAQGDISYLATLGGSSSYGWSINDAGQVAGVAQTTGNAAQHGFLYSAGTTYDLSTLGGTNSYGFGINSSGQIAGSADTSTTTRAFR
jgi:probable HAF family extracellular repeat protein